MGKGFGLVINQDADGFLFSVGRHLEETTEQSLRDFMRQYRDSNVTDFFFCVCNCTASYPSKIWTSVIDKYHQTVEAGEPVDYKDHDALKGAHHIFETLGVDNIQIGHEECHKMGINPWISFRMNDAHDHYLDRSFLLTELFHKHPEFYRVHHHSSKQYMDRIWDFAHPEIREFYLSFIEEALERYDTYGIELDFLREAWCFKIGYEYEGIDIMTDLMRQIRALVTKMSEKRGHPIQIAFRCPQTPERAMDYSFDIATYAKERLIDVLIPCGRFECNDYNLPIRLWCSIVNPYGVSVWGGIDHGNGINVYPGSPKIGATAETQYALSAAMMAQGAEKTYMFNFFRTMNQPFMKPAAEQDGSDDYWNRITHLGDPEKLARVTRRMVLTYRDYAPAGYAPSNRLPAPLSSKGYRTFRIPVGDIPEDADVYIRFGLENPDLAPEHLQVWLSSETCSFVGKEECKPAYTNQMLYVYQCNGKIPNGIAIVETMMRDEDDVLCDYVDLLIVPKN